MQNFKRTVILIVLFMMTLGAMAQTTIVNYDFNSGSSYATLTPTLASGITCSATSTETFALATGITTGTNAFTANTTAGKALAMANSSGTNTRYFQFQLSGAELSKYSTYKIYCQASRATSGATLITLAYSTDGTSFTNFGTTQTPGLSSFSECIFDLSSVTAINSQTSVYFKLLVSGASGTGAFGIDNFQVRGTACTTPTLSISATSSTICAGATTTLTGSGATNYTWSPGGATTATVAVSPTVTTTYTLTGANGVCTSSATAVITVNALPTVAISNPTPSICIGNSTTLTASGASTYTWNPGGATTTSISVSPTVTTVYTVTGTSSAGCVKTATSSVTVNSLPTLTITNSPTITCTNTAVVITSTTTASGPSYTWTPGGANTASVSVSSGGTYSLLIKDANGCMNTKTVSIITNTTAPTFTILEVSAITCANPTVVITTTATSSGYNYTWTPGGIRTSSLSVTSGGTYSLLVQDPVNGCANTKTVSVASNTTVPTLTMTNSPTITCSSPTVVITSTTTTSGVTYSWSPVSGSASSLSVTASGTYSLKVTDPSNGCSNTKTVSVSTNTSAPGITSISPTQTLTCSSPSVTLTGTSGTSGVTYSWSPGGSAPTGSATVVSSLGTYTLKVTNPVNGCYTTSTTVVSGTLDACATITDYADPNNYGQIVMSISGGLPPYEIAWNKQKLKANHDYYVQLTTDIPGLTVDTTVLYHNLDSLRYSATIKNLSPSVYVNRIYDAHHDSIDIMTIVGGVTSWYAPATVSTTTCSIPTGKKGSTIISHGNGTCLQQTGTFTANVNYAVNQSIIMSTDADSYVEFNLVSKSDVCYLGFVDAGSAITNPVSNIADKPYIYFDGNAAAKVYSGGVLTSTFAVNDGDIMGVLFDRATSTITYLKNYQAKSTLTLTPTGPDSIPDMFRRPMQTVAVLNSAAARMNNFIVITKTGYYSSSNIVPVQVVDLSCGASSGEIDFHAYALPITKALCGYSVAGPNGYAMSGILPSGGAVSVAGLSAGTYTVSVPVYAAGGSPCSTTAISTMTQAFTVAYVPQWKNPLPTGPTGHYSIASDQSYSITGNYTPYIWPGGAITENNLNAGLDGWFEFKPEIIRDIHVGSYANNQALLVGLNDLSGSSSVVNDNDYYFYITGPLSMYSPTGANPTFQGPYMYHVIGASAISAQSVGFCGPTDILRINKVSQSSGANMRFDFYKNNASSAFASSASVASYDIMVDISINQTRATVKNPRLSFGCRYTPQYALLKRKLDGGCYYAYNNKLYFKYDEEYDDTDHKLTFNVYNSSNTVVVSNASMPSAFSPSVIYGDNRYYIDLSNPAILVSGQSMPTGYYVLEVMNEKKEKWYLRFQK
ncbi:MAG: hypothetical protein JST26_07985 [Bacteroidetes bacterium]|nr:hypothetical protein [Bacteroidota bacterium]